MRSNTIARTFYGKGEEAWKRECDQLMKPRTYEVDAADTLVSMLAAFLSVDIVVFNTNPRFGGGPLMVYPASVYGGQTKVRNPIMMAYDGTHFESVLPDEEEDKEMVVILVNKLKKNEISLRFDDVECFKDLQGTWVNIVKATKKLPQKPPFPHPKDKAAYSPPLDLSKKSKVVQSYGTNKSNTKKIEVPKYQKKMRRFPTKPKSQGIETTNRYKHLSDEDGEQTIQSPEIFEGNDNADVGDEDACGREEEDDEGEKGVPTVGEISPKGVTETALGEDNRTTKETGIEETASNDEINGTNDPNSDDEVENHTKDFIALVLENIKTAYSSLEGIIVAREEEEHNEDVEDDIKREENSLSNNLYCLLGQKVTFNISDHLESSEYELLKKISKYKGKVGRLTQKLLHEWAKLSTIDKASAQKDGPKKDEQKLKNKSVKPLVPVTKVEFKTKHTNKGKSIVQAFVNDIAFSCNKTRKGTKNFRCCHYYSEGCKVTFTAHEDMNAETGDIVWIARNLLEVCDHVSTDKNVMKRVGVQELERETKSAPLLKRRKDIYYDFKSEYVAKLSDKDARIFEEVFPSYKAVSVRMWKWRTEGNPPVPSTQADVDLDTDYFKNRMGESSVIGDSVLPNRPPGFGRVVSLGVPGKGSYISI